MRWNASWKALNDGVTSAVISFLRTLLFESVTVMVPPLFFGVTGIWLFDYGNLTFRRHCRIERRSAQCVFSRGQAEEIALWKGKRFLKKFTFRL